MVLSDACLKVENKTLKYLKPLSFQKPFENHACNMCYLFFQTFDFLSVWLFSLF